MSFPWANHYQPKAPLMRWLDEKLPLPRFVYNSLGAGYPVPRLGTSLEVADLICFAASEASGYITGASLDINGGDLMM